MPIKLEIVTAEKLVFADQVDEVTAPGSDGELGILPHHAPLMTLLKPGELIYKQGSEEGSIAISGGFLEVRPDHIIVLADAAERAEEIDTARAEAARKRAEDSLAHVATEQEKALIEAALRRAIARIAIAEKLRRRRGIKR